MKTVLIVDDEPDIVILLRLALEAAGYSTVEATDGREALEVIRVAHPDVVLLDIMMPGMDGWTTLEHLEETGEHPRVIMVTAKTASRDHDRAMELGADDFVTKPFEPDELLERMRRVLPADDDQPARPSR
ncbi:MAG TPA: response regulator [Actinomycetota bacterium]|jgi:DNA-binding response OmpR family regulator